MNESIAGWTYEEVEVLSDLQRRILFPVIVDGEDSARIAMEYWAILGFEQTHHFAWYEHKVIEIAERYGVTSESVKVIARQMPRTR